MGLSSAMTTALTGLNAAEAQIDVSGNPEVGEYLQDIRRMGVSVIGGASAKFMWQLIEARIRATLRRIGHVSSGIAFDVAEYGDLKLFNATLSASVAERTVGLTPTEFALLRFLASHAERPVSKEELLHEVWG